jgi:dolichol kinase
MFKKRLKAFLAFVTIAFLIFWPFMLYFVSVMAPENGITTMQPLR